MSIFIQLIDVIIVWASLNFNTIFMRKNSQLNHVFP